MADFSLQKVPNRQNLKFTEGYDIEDSEQLRQYQREEILPPRQSIPWRIIIMVKVISIPRLNDSPADFEKLFAIWSQVNDYFEDVQFDFSQCDFLRSNAVVFFGGLSRLIESRYGTVTFEWDTLKNEKVRSYLCQNSFVEIINQVNIPFLKLLNSSTCIPYREDKIQDMNAIMDYLTDDWLGRCWIQVNQALKDAISGYVWEIYANAFEHAGSAIGVFSCGQYFPKKNALILSVIDFGQGIVANVRNFLSADPRAEHLTAAGCLRWAFKKGSTTRLGISRGMGLKLLKEFICLNQGKLEVYSNEGYALINKDGEHFENRSSSFEGTIFHITLRCDEKIYKLAYEEPPF